jgi:ABC-type transporter Mla MlaB component
VSRLLQVGETTFVLTLEGELGRDALEPLRRELERLCHRHVIVDLLDVTHFGPDAVALLGDADQVGLITIVADRRVTDMLHRAETTVNLRVHAALSDAVAEALAY